MELGLGQRRGALWMGNLTYLPSGHTSGLFVLHTAGAVGHPGTRCPGPRARRVGAGAVLHALAPAGGAECGTDAPEGGTLSPAGSTGGNPTVREKERQLGIHAPALQLDVRDQTTARTQEIGRCQEQAPRWPLIEHDRTPVTWQPDRRTHLPPRAGMW
jgi:hypothetical protein